MTSTISDQHLTEGEIVRVVDAQLAHDEHERVQTHASVCTSCAQAISLARRRKTRLSALLSVTDHEMPVLLLPADTTVLDLADARARRGVSVRWLPERAW